MHQRAGRASVIGETGHMGQIHRAVHDELATDSDFVSICTPDHLHAQDVIQALKQGRKVFCEKPLCTTRADFKAIQGLVDQGNGTLGCNFPLRFNKQFRRLKTAIENDVFGQIYYLEATYHWGRRDRLATSWRAGTDYSYMLGGGIHMIDLVKWLFPATFKPLGPAFHNNSVQIGAIRINDGALCQIVADFGSNRGDHWHEIRVRGTKTCLTVRNHAQTDKTAALRAFISGEPTPNCSEILEVMDCALTLANR